MVNNSRQTNQIESYEVSFADLFCSQNKDIRVDRVIIPMIQRDYAQGRPDKSRLRTQFLDALYGAIDSEKSTPLVLDFVYGRRYRDENKGELYFEPIDGQQRLTTLFLLNLYIVKHIDDDADRTDALQWLKGFSYETRQSSKRFCEELINMPSQAFDELEIYLKRQPWYSKRYSADPTISSMIRTLKDIAKHYIPIKANAYEMGLIWNRVNKNITFMLLYLKNLNATDDLYIKMNSRGLHLTDFEKFKAELEGFFKGIKQSQEMDFGVKIDTIWTNLLWDYRDKGQDGIDVDIASYDPHNISPYTQNGLDGKLHHIFRRYMSIEGTKARLFTKIILKEDEEIVEIKPFSDDPKADLISMSEIVFKNVSDKDKEQHMLRLCRFLDMIYHASNVAGRCDKEMVSKFFYNFVYTGESPEDNLHKVRLFGKSGDFGTDLLNAFAYDGEINLGLILIIEAFIEYANTNIDAVIFKDRLRIVRNLIANSDVSNENMASQLNRVDTIIRSGDLGLDESDFNLSQKQQEKIKNLWMTSHVSQDENLVGKLIRIENNDVIWGDLSTFISNNISDSNEENLIRSEYFDKFMNVFPDNSDVDWMLRHQALMAIEDYARSVNELCLYAGSKKTLWRSQVFGRGNQSVYPYVLQLLDKIPSNENADVALNNIRNYFLSECELEGKESMPWRYYAVKYRGVQRGEDRKVYKYKGKKYAVIAYNKTAGNCQRWNVFHNRISIEDGMDKCFNLENYENRLELTKLSLRAESAEHDFLIRPQHVETPIFRLPIPQNTATGYDSVDRIKYFIAFYNDFEKAFLEKDPDILSSIVSKYGIKSDDGISEITDLYHIGENSVASSEDN